MSNRMRPARGPFNINLVHLILTYRRLIMITAFTFFLMLVIWDRISRMLFDPSTDIANFGIPLILYEPRASLIGWMGVIVVRSPILQIFPTGIASSIRLAWFPRPHFGNNGSDE